MSKFQVTYKRLTGIYFLLLGQSFFPSGVHQNQQKRVINFKKSYNFYNLIIILEYTMTLIY